MFDLELIAKECGLNSDIEDDKVIQNIMLLEHKYEESELVEIYNYFIVNSKNPNILKYVIKLSDMYRDKSTLGILVNLLLFQNEFKDNEIDRENFVNVRVMCVKAIANYKEASAIAPLLYCLNSKDENYKVRLACADSLGKFGDKYAVEPLIDLVKNEDEKSVYVRESAAVALGILGDSRAIEPFLNILEAKKGFLDKFTFLKERVLEALGKINPTSSKDEARIFKVLKKSLLDESPQIRINAIEGLMNSDYSEAYDLIKECLFDKDDEVKKNALIALYNMSGRDILDEVLRKSEYCAFLKNSATEILEEYEDER